MSYQIGSTCQCLQQCDLHSHLLWNAGNGRLLCYKFLLNVVHAFVTGHPFYAQFETRILTFMNGFNLQTSLPLKVFRESVIGFSRNLTFEKSDFSCDVCRKMPEYLLCDGKMTGISIISQLLSFTVVAKSLLYFCLLFCSKPGTYLKSACHDVISR